MTPPRLRLPSILLLFASAASAPGAFAADSTAPRPDSGLYLKVQLASPVKLPKLKPGDVVAGNLARDVYSADHKLLSAGSRVDLTVDHLEKRRRARSDHWPWVVTFFTPRHENFPAFKSAVVDQPVGKSTLQVSLISLTRMREVHAQAKKSKPPPAAGSEQGSVEVSRTAEKKSPTATLILEASQPDASASASSSDEPHAVSDVTLPSATRCKILLLGDVSASRSNPGDVVRARLLEPVVLDSRVVLPAGTQFEGRVVKKTPPRIFSRAGALYITFTQLQLPGASPQSIVASLAGAELNQASHTRIDSEGQLHGEHPGKAWMAINLGVTAGVAKVSDDTLQLIIELIVSTATDASTAGSGRIIAACASGIFMATRHGRDVVLPRFTEMEISLDRPVTLQARVPAGAALAGGK